VSASGWIMMVIILVGVWGGFAYLLLETAKRRRD